MLGVRIKFKIVLMCIFVFAVTGCGKKKEGKIPVKASVEKTSSNVVNKASGASDLEKAGDAEPNNTIEEANSVQVGRSFDLSVNPVGDKDWFKVDLPGQGYLRVQSSDVPKGIGSEIRYAIFDEWGDEKQKEIRGWHRLPDACFIPKAGTYYFVIGDDYSDNFSKESMKIKVDFLNEFDSSEPNDNVKKATSVAIGEAKTIALYPEGDKDLFKIKVEKQGYLNIKMKGDFEKVAPEVQYFLYDEWADPKEKVVRSWKRLPDACPVMSGNEYYIRIHDDYDDEAEETIFDVKFDFIEEMDKYEPNNSYKQAKEININDTLLVSIFPTGDKDYFKINAAGANKLKIMTKDVFGSVAPEIRLYTEGEDSSELKSASAWKKLPSEFGVDSGKTYYVLLHDDYDDKSNANVFGLKIESDVSEKVEDAKEEIGTESESTPAAEQETNVADQPSIAEIVFDEDIVQATEERQKIIEAQKKKREEMLKRRQQVEEHQAEMKRRQDEKERKRLEAMKAMHSQ